MKSSTIPWAIAAFALGCATATTAQQMVVPTARAATAPAWQYACTTFEAGITEVKFAENNQVLFNDFGAKGWELVGKLGPNMVCFKRPG